MKAVIICDDIAFAAKADATLRRTGGRDDIQIQWVVKYWPASALHGTALAEKALVEALDAHLIVLPAQDAEFVPSWLVDWLNRWAEQRQIQDAALGFLSDSNATARTQSVCPELSILIQGHGLNIIMDRAAASPESTKISLRFSDEGEISLPVVRESSVNPISHYSYRGIGINE
jgi:hypothetical protein